MRSSSQNFGAQYLHITLLVIKWRRLRISTNVREEANGDTLSGVHVCPMALACSPQEPRSSTHVSLLTRVSATSMAEGVFM